MTVDEGLPRGGVHMPVIEIGHVIEPFWGPFRMWFDMKNIYHKYFSGWQTFIKIIKANGSIGIFRGYTLMSVIINYWIHFLYMASNSWKLLLSFLLRAILQSGSFLCPQIIYGI